MSCSWSVYNCNVYLHIGVYNIIYIYSIASLNCLFYSFQKGTLRPLSNVLMVYARKFNQNTYSPLILTAIYRKSVMEKVYAKHYTTTAPITPRDAAKLCTYKQRFISEGFHGNGAGLPSQTTPFCDENADQRVLYTRTSGFVFSKS